MYLLAFLLFGLVVGLLARALMPGSQSMGMLSTMLLGAAGSFVGGMVGNLLAGTSLMHAPTAAGWIGSILGSLLLLLFFSRSRARMS